MRRIRLSIQSSFKNRLSLNKRITAVIIFVGIEIGVDTENSDNNSNSNRKNYFCVIY